MKVKEDIISLETDFANNEYFGTNVWTEEKFRVLSGNNPVIFSAPHAVNQIRGNDVRNAEKYTGAFVRYISGLTNSYAIYQIFTHADPNNDEEHNYKNAVINLIEAYKLKLLIDVHTSTFSDDCDIDIVTNNHESLCGNENLIKKLKLLGIKYNIKMDEKNAPNAEKESEIIGVTSLICGIPSIRIVINKDSLNVIKDENKFRRICKLFEEFIQEIDKENVK